MEKIEVSKLKKFTLPLKAIRNNIPSVIFSKNGDTFHVNAKTEDGSKLVNLRFTNDTIKLKKTGDIKKLGIYNLDEFINILSMFGQEALDVTKEDNKLLIKFNDKSEVSYVLSDIKIIEDKEGPSEPKAKIDFFITFEINKNFFKKIKNISNTVDGKNLNLIMEDGTLSYSIGEDCKHTHHYIEELLTDCDSEDFIVSLPIKTDGKDNFAFIVDSYPYRVSIHSKIVQLEAITEDYELLRYFIAPIKK